MPRQMLVCCVVSVLAPTLTRRDQIGWALQYERKCSEGIIYKLNASGRFFWVGGGGGGSHSGVAGVSSPFRCDALTLGECFQILRKNRRAFVFPHDMNSPNTSICPFPEPKKEHRCGGHKFTEVQNDERWKTAQPQEIPQTQHHPEPFLQTITNETTEFNYQSFIYSPTDAPVSCFKKQY